MMTATPSSVRRPWTVRVAAFSARHRWPVAGIWFVLTAGLFAASLAMGGTKAAEAVSGDQRARFEAAQAYELFAASGRTEEQPAGQGFLLLLSAPASTVDDRPFASAIADAVARMTALRATVGGTDSAVFENVIDPLRAPAAAALVSPDRTTVRISATLPGEGEVISQRLAPVPAFLDDLRASHPAYRIHALNNTLANQEISELVNGGLDASLRLTIPLTFLILLVAFRAVVAAAIPLVLAVTALLAAFGILGLYSQLVAPVSPYASQLIVLIGLAVAVDYSLFMVTRFRSERRRGRTRTDAIDVASSTAGRAVFFSGVAVMISIGGLFMLDDPLFRSMAIGTIAVVFIAVVGSLTFLPATLAILGDGVDRLRVPFLSRNREEGSGLWAAVVRRVMRRPLALGLLTAAILVAVAAPVTRLRMGQSDFEAFPDSLDGVQAINLLNDKWPTGTTLEFQVVVTHADRAATQAAVDALSDRLAAVDGLTGPPRTRMSRDGTVALVTWLMGGGRNDQANRDIVGAVRSTIVPQVFGGLPDVRALVTGEVAYEADVVGFYSGGMPPVMAFVLGLSFVLLLLAFRSIVIPIKAIVLNLLSTGAAYGLLVVVFQEGWLSGPLGFKPGVIEPFVPVFVFTILFGLSMDYHVFILTRIKEARDRGVPSNEAVARGISITAGTVTSAAAIMVVVFAVFVTLELFVVKQLGFGLAVAVFLDATVVRSILLPASMRLLGEWNWWLPGFLSWLPRVTVEAGPDEGELGRSELPAGA